MTSLAGLEPATFGSTVRCTENTSPANTKTCETLKSQLTPESSKQSEIDTSELPPDLAQIAAIWPELPKHIKVTINTLVQTHNLKDN